MTLNFFPSEWDEYSREAAQRYRVDPDMLISVACLESSYGESALAINHHNLHGIRGTDTADGFRHFDADVESFIACAYLFALSRHYDHVRGDIRAFGSVYCPTDPEWGDKVLSIYRRIRIGRRQCRQEDTQ